MFQWHRQCMVGRVGDKDGVAVLDTTANCSSQTSPQQGDLKLSGPPTSQGAGGRARTCDRKVPADFRADSLSMSDM
ncbi:hypothetical protein PoB_004193600 [Plakobranchus ocellatus]|uniref:Uncharacterized protein n=1 Tax=Plakobranchus ocellatus TaxID=259542 RepID=A0AAV4AWD9_9GAST|nr:hypothetical protein PoB_004193600 [Plakobranchus ocellatus]